MAVWLLKHTDGCTWESHAHTLRLLESRFPVRRVALLLSLALLLPMMVLESQLDLGKFLSGKVV